MKGGRTESRLSCLTGRQAASPSVTGWKAGWDDQTRFGYELGTTIDLDRGWCELGSGTGDGLDYSLVIGDPPSDVVDAVSEKRFGSANGFGKDRPTSRSTDEQQKKSGITPWKMTPDKT